ncbi:hypothetical protein F0562_026999 [Nyssa sinensis]|uniref:Annexin n=1 Tax=Nyssa sinensis TaxID=561372 RepID=A0A5J5B433_9ASTE|nr:hypothetical protein F0562_026999 [Nyssa sinensis]
MATLIALDHPSPVGDAEALRKACQGWGTDEKAIISIIGHRNAVQRKLIRQAYEEIYHEDLVKRLESELSGDFEKAVNRWILDPADRDAVMANVAIKETIPDYRVIIEISCIRSPEELLAVKRAYQNRYKYNGDEINEALADSEADILHNVIKEKALNHEEIFRIVSTRSKAQLMATLNCFKDDHGSSITKHLVDDPADQYLLALRTAIRCINDPQKYYEKVMRNALNKAGTNEDALTRVIVTRAEKDLNEIKELYYKRNSVSLDHDVANETSGDYKEFLLTLLGKED